MLLRHVALRSISQRYALQQRTLVTSAQKRALNKQQLSGTPPTEAAGTKATTTTTNPSSSGGATSNKPASSSGGNSNLLVGGLAVVAGGLGLAYYNDMLPLGGEAEKVEETKAVVVEDDVKVEESPIVSKDDVEVKTSEVSSPKEVPTKTTEEVEDDKSVSRGVSVARIAQLGFPPKVDRGPQIVPVVEQPKDGHRVTVEGMNEVVLGATSNKPASSARPQTSTKTEIPPETPPETPSIPTPKPNPPTAIEAAAELRLHSNDKSSAEILSALRLLKSDLDESFLSDLDSLSPSELKIRIVRLASEMSERARWEAVRTRELLRLKETETADKYGDILQSQRHEFEDLLSQRLREQEDVLQRRHRAEMREKEDAVKALIDATTESLTQEHDQDLTSMKERLERQLSSKYESMFKNQLAEHKSSFAKQMEEKLQVLQKLNDQVTQLQEMAKLKQDFETGSMRAHRISAAGLALSQRLETNKEAVMEVAALKAAAGGEGVIAAAVKRLPNSVRTGVPTLTELQARWKAVHSAGRQAAMVPENQSDLASQILGIVFSKLTVPPSPEEHTTQDSPDAILSVARYHVSNGNLEEAVKALESLKGQAAFTVKDWKKDAMDRIVADKAVKIIKMECAMMNQSMSGDGNE